MSFKQIKDSVYGYVDIADDIVFNIIDSSAFQRLRSIRQTGYSPLYPASMHNRFIHSIGVFHLGKLVADNLSEILKQLNIHDQIDLESVFRVFTLACLLHDIGHSPFSHAGEKFFLYLQDTEDSDVRQLFLGAHI